MDPQDHIAKAAVKAHLPIGTPQIHFAVTVAVSREALRVSTISDLQALVRREFNQSLKELDLEVLTQAVLERRRGDKP